jgi:hypothetical protein
VFGFIDFRDFHCFRILLQPTAAVIVIAMIHSIIIINPDAEVLYKRSVVVIGGVGWLRC